MRVLRGGGRFLCGFYSKAYFDKYKNFRSDDERYYTVSELRELVKQNKNIMALCRGNNDGTEVLTFAEQSFFDEINLWDLHKMLKEVF